MNDSEERPRREAPPSFLPAAWDPAAPAPRYAMGKRVRLGVGAPKALQGISGVVERVAGHFAPDPGAAKPGAAKSPLYRARVAFADLWGDGADGFEPEDTLDLELFETTLEPFFDYAAFDAEKIRLDAALGATLEIDEEARLAALSALATASSGQGRLSLQPTEDARHIVLAPDLAPALRRAALRRPRAHLEHLGETASGPLRLHLASGRIIYRVV